MVHLHLRDTLSYIFRPVKISVLLTMSDCNKGAVNGHEIGSTPIRTEDSAKAIVPK